MEINGLMPIKELEAPQVGLGYFVASVGRGVWLNIRYDNENYFMGKNTPNGGKLPVIR